MQWWATQRPARGETVCGDDFVVVGQETPLIAVADGLGHGSAARAASRGFCSAIEQHASEALDTLMQRGAAAVQGTRGAAAALLRIDEHQGTGCYVGVGNIDLRSTSRHISVASRPGIVGSRLPRLFEHRFKVTSGDVIVLFSDGVSGRMRLSELSETALCDWPGELLRKYGKFEDDATCVVLHCDGIATTPQ